MTTGGLVALDPDSHLVLSDFAGKRLTDKTVILLEDVRKRLGGRASEVVTTDGWPGYYASTDTDGR